MKNHRIKFIQVLLIAVLLYIFIDNINLNNFLSKFTSDFLLAILVSQIPIILSILLIAYRHLYFVHNDKLTFKVAFNAIVIGTGFNYILPARISEFLKATYIRDKSDIPFGIGVGAVFLERLSDLIIVGILGLVSIVFLALDFNLYLALSILLAAFIAIAIIITFKEKIIWLFEKLIKWEGLQTFITNIFIHIHTQVYNKRFLYGLLMSIGIWSFSALTVGTFMNIAGDIDFGVIPVITLLIGGAIGLAIPALPGGLGTFEAVAVVVMMKFGYDFDTSMALAIGLRLTNMAVILPAAIWIAFKNGTGLANMLNDLKMRNKKINDQ